MHIEAFEATKVPAQIMAIAFQGPSIGLGPILWVRSPPAKAAELNLFQLILEGGWQQVVYKALSPDRWGAASNLSFPL